MARERRKRFRMLVKLLINPLLEYSGCIQIRGPKVRRLMLLRYDEVLVRECNKRAERAPRIRLPLSSVPDLARNPEKLVDPFRESADRPSGLAENVLLLITQVYVPAFHVITLFGIGRPALCVDIHHSLSRHKDEEVNL